MTIAIQLSGGTYALLRRRSQEMKRDPGELADELLRISLSPSHPYIEAVRVRSGLKAMIKGTRTSVATIIGYVRLGETPESIATEVLPYLSPAQVHDALSYFHRYTAEVILAEVGPNVTPFPTAKHLAAWACLCPGNDVSASKRRSGKTRHGQKWLCAALVEAAWAAGRSKDTNLAAQFQRLRLRRGDKRAAVAVAHSILTSVYQLLANPAVEFSELGGDFFVKKNPAQEQRRAVKRLEALGFQVTLAPASA